MDIPPKSALSKSGMVVAGHPLAAEAGKRVLSDGGNATDAAVAAAAVLAVVCPYACSPGGDVFALVYDAASDTVGGLNGSGVAPAGATAEVYADGIPQTGPLSISVPGLFAGLHDLLERYGTRPWAELLAPAIALAADGFPAHSQFIRNTEARADLIAKDAECTRLFMPGGKPFGESAPVRQPDLADTLARVAADGPGGFYSGTVAARLAAGIVAAGGVMTADDLARHESLWQDPIAAPFAGHEVLTMPPNSYGLTLLFQLMELERGGIASVDPASADFVLRGLAARRAAYAATDGLIGDPATLEAPARAKLAQVIAAGGGAGDSGAPDEARDRCTACVVVLDAQGNAVSLIESISAPYGSGIVARGTGVLLNNRMRGFADKPGHPNALAPGKRPAHTLAPCLVMKDGVPKISIGTPGTVGQTCVLAQILVRMLACGQSSENAVAAPRWSVALDGTPTIEKAMDEGLAAALAAEIPDLKSMPNGWITFGSVKIAMVTGDGLLGIADGRRIAAPIGL
jgi:gamma-glutamyltranspeptidase/glutathione hydrolase